MKQEILKDICESIGRLEGKVDGINGRLDKINGSIINHDGRINGIETFRDNLIGKISIIGIIFGFIGSIAVSLINWLFKKI